VLPIRGELKYEAWRPFEVLVDITFLDKGEGGELGNIVSWLRARRPTHGRGRRVKRPVGLHDRRGAILGLVLVFRES
jgi:hypothetical protein